MEESLEPLKVDRGGGCTCMPVCVKGLPLYSRGLSTTSLIAVPVAREIQMSTSYCRLYAAGGDLQLVSPSIRERTKAL